MSDPRASPCGSWPSPWTPAVAAAGAVSLGHPSAAAGVLYWIEGRPAEQGRSVLMARPAGGPASEVLDSSADVRSRVHEYGGMPYAVLGGRVAHAGFKDQRWRVQSVGSDRTAVSEPWTPTGCRYADADVAPDGHSLVCVREDHRRDGEPANGVVRLDLDQPGGAGHVLYDGSDFVAWPRLSADGLRLALVAWDHPAMPWDETRLLVVECQPGVESTTPRLIAGGPGISVLEPQWDADGSLYFLSDERGWWNLYRWRDGETEAVLEIDAEIGGALWQLGMRSYALTGDGRALLRIGSGAVDRLAWLDLDSRALHPLALPYVGFGQIGLLDANTAFALASPIDRPPVLVTIDLRTAESTVIRESAAAPIGPDFVSHPQAIEFPTQPAPDGTPRTAHAWFYPPQLPGYQPLPGEQPPLMVMLHGGPTGHSGSGFKTTVQFWTSRGYAVVDVNYGGSTGYGRDYRQRLIGEWGRVDLQDAVAVVDHLAGLGLIDGQRVAIRGGSAGGYTVLSALAFSRRFAAGINYYGVADLETLATDTHKFESRYLDSLVAPWPEGREVYRARSPAHHMGRCRSALITFQGSEDKAVPPQQSRAIVAAARAAGCPVAYLEFDGEGHGFRKGPNIVRALEHELVFLGRVFGTIPAGDLPPVEIANDGELPPLAAHSGPAL